VVPEGPDRIVRVTPDVPAIHRRFDYSVPPAMAAGVHLGSRVRVDLNGRRVAGWVVEDDVATVAGMTVKPLAGSSGEGPPPAVVSLAEWAAWRWAGPLSSLLGTASPERIVARPAVGDPSAITRPPSPGGGSVALVSAALDGATRPSVIRLAPTLDAVLVVLELIHRTGPAGVVVLAPSRVRAAHLAARLDEAGMPVALMPDAWAQAATGDRVVVGTRSAAWSPLAHLRAAVILDAHDEAYREERAPTWSAVEVTIERGRRDGAPVLLVSSCPPLVLTEGANVVTTPRPVERRGWPVVEVVDRRGDDPRTGLFSERLVRVVRGALDGPDGRVVCVLNRIGRILLLACRPCGALARCTRCGGAMAQDAAAAGLRCRRCGEVRPGVCAECDSTQLKSLRVGVSRAAEELAALTGVEAAEVTGASDRGLAPTGRLVVGTEAALHRVDRADLVVFLDIDQHLLAPRFAAGEEALALLARAARLVGARPAGGRVLVQTRVPDHEVLAAAVDADPDLVARAEREVRLALGLPPFGALTVLRGPGGAEYAEGLRRLGTVTVSSVDADRWIVRAGDHAAMADALAAVPRPQARLRVEVDATEV
jgi:primosomal protein N' (replication factor Y)